MFLLAPMLSMRGGGVVLSQFSLSVQFKERRRKGERLAVEGDAESQWMIVDMSDIQVGFY